MSDSSQSFEPTGIEATLAAAERALEEVRQTLAHAQAETGALQQRHADVVGSRLRLGILRARRTVGHVIRHPIDSAQYGFYLVGQRGLSWSVRSSLRRFVTREIPIRGLAVFDDDRGGREALRWMGPVRIRSTEHDALFAHPPASTAWKVPSTSAEAIVARVALLPQTWLSNADGVEFEMRVTDGTGKTTSATRTSHPARRWRDRAWRPLRIRLPQSAGELHVELITRVPPGASHAHAWAVWGDPAVVARRPLPELLRSIQSAVRHFGIRGALARLRTLQPETPDDASYHRWLSRHAPDAVALAAEVAAWEMRPSFSVITPVRDTDPTLLRECIESVCAQIYPEWELCLADDGSSRADTRQVIAEYGRDPRIRVVRLDRPGHICAASNAALQLATGDYVVTLDHDDMLAPDALVEVARELRLHPETDFLYSDEDKIDERGQRCQPHFKPDWSPELFRSYMYTCHLLVLRRSLVEAVGGFRQGFEGAQDYDLALRVVELTPHIRHVPRVLYHWRKLPTSTAHSLHAKPWAVDAGRRVLEDHVRRTGLAADVMEGLAPGLFRLRHHLENRPLVSLVVLTDAQTKEVHGRSVDLLANTVRSIVQKTTYRNYELIVVDNGRISDGSVAVLESTPHRRVSYRYEGAFNFSHKLNFAVSHATGEHIVLLNDDLEVIASEWLSAMLEHSQHPEVGAVGARLRYPDGRLQHVGMLVGVGAVAAHPFHMYPAEHTGYFSNAIVVRNCSAVTAACLMTRRSVFDEVGGFSERLPIDFNDVDFCLKVRQRGYRIVYTPYAELYHLESATFGGRLQDANELRRMREGWGEALTRDPYYNPNLTKDHLDYRLGE